MKNPETSSRVERHREIYVIIRITLLQLTILSSPSVGSTLDDRMISFGQSPYRELPNS